MNKKRKTKQFTHTKKDYSTAVCYGTTPLQLIYTVLMNFSTWCFSLITVAWPLIFLGTEILIQTSSTNRWLTQTLGNNLIHAVTEFTSNT